MKAGRCCYKSSAEQFRELTAGKEWKAVPTLPRLEFNGAPLKVEVTQTSDLSPNILHEADSITGNGGERNDSYNHPRPNFKAIAAGWSVIFGVPVTPQQVALAQVWTKVVRENHKHKRDNLVDIAGYARCIERLDEGM